MIKKHAVIIGVGPGLGRQLGLRFSQEGYTVTLMARHQRNLEPVAGDILVAGGDARSVTVDACDPDSVCQGFARARKQAGDPELLVYNAGAFQPGGIMELAPDVFERCWRANCYGGFLAAREVLPAMQKAGNGTIIFTGATASRRGGKNFAALAVGKFGLRALAQSMAREFGPRGIHVAHVIIDGQIMTPTNLQRFPDRDKQTFLDPEAIAQTYWSLHRQDCSSWTLELDLRPATEQF